LTVAGCYVPFTDIGAAVMKMLADTRGIKIDDADKKELTDKFSTMPPYPEVPAALQSCAPRAFGCSRSRTICWRFKPASSSTAASSICSSGVSAPTA
jgi:hypothetical protein